MRLCKWEVVRRYPIGSYRVGGCAIPVRGCHIGGTGKVCQDTLEAVPAVSHLQAHQHVTGTSHPPQVTQAQPTCRKPSTHEWLAVDPWFEAWVIHYVQ